MKLFSILTIAGGVLLMETAATPIASTGIVKRAAISHVWCGDLMPKKLAPKAVAGNFLFDGEDVSKAYLEGTRRVQALGGVEPAGKGYPHIFTNKYIQYTKQPAGTSYWEFPIMSDKTIYETGRAPEEFRVIFSAKDANQGAGPWTYIGLTRHAKTAVFPCTPYDGPLLGPQPKRGDSLPLAGAKPQPKRRPTLSPAGLRNGRV